MPEVQELGNSIPSSLHYALTDSQCNKCGAQLEWKAEFSDINSPKYTSKHCNQDYMITVDSVKVEMVRQSDGQGANEKTGKKQHEQQPKAITMAEKLKYKSIMTEQG
jgi:hypothetical protein